MAVRKAFMCLGKVIPSKIKYTVAVNVPKKVLDTNLNMYFSEWTLYHAIDKMEKCKPGDIVLLKELQEPASDDVLHEVKEIVFPRGNITDPISGERCIGSKLLSELEEDNLTVGGRLHPNLDIDHSDRDLSPVDHFPKHIDVKLVD